jgi:hypothetical protein
MEALEWAVRLRWWIYCLGNNPYICARTGFDFFFYSRSLIDEDFDFRRRFDSVFDVEDVAGQEGL